MAVLALTLAGFAIALNVQVLAALGPFLRDEIGVDKAEFGRLVAGGWIGGAVGAVLLLPFVDRVGRRAPILVGGGLFVVAGACHMLVDSYAQFLAVRIAAGLAGGGVFTVASAAVADLVPYERRGRAMGVFNLSIFLAVPVGMPLATTFAEHGAWQAIFAVQVGFALLALVGVAMTVPPALGRGGERMRWNVLLVPSVIPALLSVVLYSGAFATATQFLGIWLDRAAIVAKEDQQSVWIVLGLVSAGGTAFLTRFADTVGKRAFVIVTSLVVGAGFALLSVVESWGLLVVIGVPIAVCTAARSGAMQALVSGLVPTERRGSLMALRAVAVSAGMGLIVSVGGEVYEALDYAGVLWLAAGSVGLSLVCVLFFVREGEA